MPPTQRQSPLPPPQAPPFDPWSLHQPSRPPHRSSPLGLILVALAAVALIAWGMWTATHDGTIRSNASPAPSGAASGEISPLASEPGTPPSETGPATTPTSSPSSPPGPRATRETPATATPGQALQQLSALEARWCQANFKGDRTALMDILADEYKSVGRGPQSKEEYLRVLKRDEFVETWSFSNLQLQSLQGDQATVSGEMTAIYPGTTRHWKFVDTFVLRNGRWQATSSHTVED